ncbi:MAG TPA: GNAT family N-acetyltransferase [Micavibrio sp.]|nr:GNAT family N-acetyltransferase [Micavibrio sp.]
MMQAVTDNTQKSRFELVEEGYVAYADYRRDGKTLYINYVFSPPELRGKGTAGRLMEGIVAAAQAADQEIYPICGYAAAWLRRHNQT